MTHWMDNSDSRSRFFDGGEASASEAIDELLACLLRKILGSGAAKQFSLLLFEVNCDTGRLMVGATTAEQHETGVVDGCSLRVQEVQDYWYDLMETEPTDEQFTSAIQQYVHGLGCDFRDNLISHIGELAHFCSSEGFTFRIYGNAPEVISQQHFEATG